VVAARVVAARIIALQPPRPSHSGPSAAREGAALTRDPDKAALHRDNEVAATADLRMDGATPSSSS
jgi:hypothetical protein